MQYLLMFNNELVLCSTDSQLTFPQTPLGQCSSEIWLSEIMADITLSFSCRHALATRSFCYHHAVIDLIFHAQYEHNPVIVCQM